MKTAIITLSYRRPDLFCRMADSISAKDDPTWTLAEAILVNNGGDAETRDAATARGWRVLEPGQNLSFSAGCNLAASTTDASHLLLLNNDAIIHTGALAALWAHRDDPLVGCMIMNADGTLNHAGGKFVGVGPQHLGRHEDPAHYRDDQLVPWVTFACVQIRHALWDALGGLDERYWYGYEDVDFSLRACERGVKPLVAADAVVTHEEMSTRAKLGGGDSGQVFGRTWIEGGRLQRALARFESEAA